MSCHRSSRWRTENGWHCANSETLFLLFEHPNGSLNVNDVCRREFASNGLLAQTREKCPKSALQQRPTGPIKHQLIHRSFLFSARRNSNRLFRFRRLQLVISTVSKARKNWSNLLFSFGLGGMWIRQISLSLSVCLCVCLSPNVAV